MSFIKSDDGKFKSKNQYLQNKLRVKDCLLLPLLKPTNNEIYVLNTTFYKLYKKGKLIIMEN